MSEVAEVAPWVQTGSLLAFAGAVLWELRQLRPLFERLVSERQEDRSLIADVRVILAALLERERIRDERKRRDSDRPPSTPIPVEQWPEDESTGLHEIMARQRRSARIKTPAGGVRPPRPGTHHDE